MFKKLDKMDVQKKKAEEKAKEKLKETIKLKFQAVSAEDLEKTLFLLKAKRKTQGSIKA